MRLCTDMSWGKLKAEKPAACSPVKSRANSCAIMLSVQQRHFECHEALNQSLLAHHHSAAIRAGSTGCLRPRRLIQAGTCGKAVAKHEVEDCGKTLTKLPSALIDAFLADAVDPMLQPFSKCFSAWYSKNGDSTT